jgi:hypothetical protein
VALEQRLRAGGDREIDAVERRHLGDLLGGALVQVQPHLGVLLAERLDHPGQHVAGLGVGGGDRERAARFVLEVVREALDVLHLAQDAHGAIDHLLPGRRDAREVAAIAHEDLEAELVLEQLDLLRHPRLRGVQLLGRRRDVEARLGHCGQVSQLVQLHCAILAKGFRAIPGRLPL